MIRNMLNKTYNKPDFSIQLKKTFFKIRTKLNIIQTLKEGEKLGKNDKNEYEIYSNGIGQQLFRWWYSENRETTVMYLDEDFSNYMKFLDELCYYLEKDVLGIYSVFANQVKEYNKELIAKLYILKETYRMGGGETINIVAKIDSIILTLIDFKDNVLKYKEKNETKYSILKNMKGNAYSSD